VYYIMNQPAPQIERTSCRGAILGRSPVGTLLHLLGTALKLNLFLKLLVIGAVNNALRKTNHSGTNKKTAPTTMLLLVFINRCSYFLLFAIVLTARPRTGLAFRKSLVDVRMTFAVIPS